MGLYFLRILFKNFNTGWAKFAIPFHSELEGG